MLVRALQHRIQVAQPVAHCPGRLPVGDVVQDRLVVLVHQHHDPLAELRVRLLDQVGQITCQILRRQIGWRWQAQRHAVDAQVAPDAVIQPHGGLRHAVRKTDADHWMPPCPVPARLGRQPLEQRPLPLEQRLERVQQQALAETARAAQEVVLARLDQVDGHARLVHVVVVVLADLAEGLDADRQLAPSRAGVGAGGEGRVHPASLGRGMGG